MYQPFPKEKFECIDRELWFQELNEHIRPQAESEPYVTDTTRACALPVEVQTIYFLRIFLQEAGGNGIQDFLLQQQGVFSKQVHEALGRVGATELVRRLEAGIPHALAADAEFTGDGDMAWFKRFPPVPEFPSLESVDEDSEEFDMYEMINHDLSSKVTEYIVTNKELLIA
jgi:hypothetical protein